MKSILSCELMPRDENFLRISLKNFFIFSFLRNRVKDLSKQIGDELLTLAEAVTRRNEVQEVNCKLEHALCSFARTFDVIIRLCYALK